MMDGSCACPPQSQKGPQALTVPQALNRHYRSAVAAAAAAGVLPADPLATPVAQARLDALRWHRWWHGRLPHVRGVAEHAAPGPVGPVPLRFFYHRRLRSQPLAIYFHGGGFVLNGAGTHERVLRDLAVRADVAVCGVDYSLAPEHRYPVQLEEAVASVRWILRYAAELGVDPDRIALCGDSAGANLALATACRLRDEGVPIRFLLLFYGMYAHDFETSSHRAYGGGAFGLSSERMRWYWQQYLRNDGDAADPGAVPLHADLRGLPPMLVVAAGLDCLRDDSLRLAARLEAAGVSRVLSVYEDLPHGFLAVAPAVARADDALAEGVDALARLRRRRRYAGWVTSHRNRQALHRRVAETLSALADAPDSAGLTAAGLTAAGQPAADPFSPGAAATRPAPARKPVSLLVVRRHPDQDFGSRGAGAGR